MTAFQRAFYRRWRNTCLIRRPDFRRCRGSRAAVLKLEELSESLQYLISEDIRSPEELESKQSDLGNERKAVQSELSSLRTKLYRSDICRLVSRREALKAEGWLDVEDEKKLAEIDEKIAAIMPLPQAVRYYDSLVRKKDMCIQQLREIRRQENMLR